MSHEQFEHQSAANTMENEMFELKNVVNTVEMAASNSRLLQMAWKMDTAGNPKKNPKQFRFFSQMSPRLYGDVRIPAMAMRFSCGAALSG